MLERLSLQNSKYTDWFLYDIQAFCSLNSEFSFYCHIEGRADPKIHYFQSYESPPETHTRYYPSGSTLNLFWVLFLFYSLWKLRYKLMSIFFICRHRCYRYLNWNLRWFFHKIRDCSCYLHYSYPERLSNGIWDQWLFWQSAHA